MPANQTPIFILPTTSGNGKLRLTSAAPFRDGSTLSASNLLYTSGANGSRVDQITFTHFNTSAGAAGVASVGRVYVCQTSTGGSPVLHREIQLPVLTPSTTVIGQSQTMTFSPPIILQSGEFLMASISVAQTSGGYDVVAYGGDF